MNFYKAVDVNGLSFFPFKKEDRINWINLIGQDFTLGDEEGWLKAVEKLRAGDTTCCTKHLLHGYADIMLAVDFGQRQAVSVHGTRPGIYRSNNGFRIVEFTGNPVAQLEGTLLLGRMWEEEKDRERFADAVKYGFRSLKVLREVPESEWGE